MAIAEAVAERLGNRQGGDRKTDQAGNISGLIDKGETRDLAAAKAGFGSGKTLEAAQAVTPVAIGCKNGVGNISQPHQGKHMSDAWRYCENLNDPEAIKKLVQAAITANATIHFAKTQVNPEEFGTVPDWGAVQRELKDALRAVGHPAGQ